MKLTIFGATGRTGHLLVEQALAAGHEVTAFARNPAKLGVTNDRLRVVQGDLTDAAQIEAAIRGANAVLSVLGPSNNQATHTISRGMDLILAAMKQTGVRRLIMSAGAGVRDPQDKPGAIDSVFGALLKVTARNVYEDMVQAVAKVRASDLDWTVVRVPMLTDDPAKGKLKIGYLGSGVSPRISRADMAEFILKQAGDRAYLHQAPVISN
jgi:putative NADH-flavin reductase